MSQQDRKPIETEEELIDAFLALLSEGAPDTEEEVDAFLVGRGYNIEELNDRAERVFKPALAASLLDWRNRARQEMNAAREKMADSIHRKFTGRQEIIEAIQDLLQGPGPVALAHFRNIDLENISDEDLQSTWEEYEFLQASDKGSPAESE